MLLFKPEIHFYKRMTTCGIRYRLLIYTWVDHTGYKEDGHEFLATTPEANENGVPVFKLRVNARLVDPDAVVAPRILVHTVALDGIPFPDAGQLVEVYFFTPEENGPTRKGIGYGGGVENEDERPCQQIAASEYFRQSNYID